MAIYVPSIDYGATAKAIELEYGSEINKIKAQEAEKTQRSLDIQESRIRDNRSEMFFNAALEAANIGIKAYQLVEQEQLAKAKTKGLADLGEFSELVVQSVLNEKTFATQDANGEWTISMDPQLSSWYQRKVSEIDGGKGSKAVKRWALDNLNTIWNSGRQQILSNVLAKSKDTIDQQHAFTMQEAIKLDIGDSTFADRSCETGFSAIDSRIDLHPAQKSVQKQIYQRSVDIAVDQRQVEAVTAVGGLAAASAMVHGWSRYTPEEKSALIAQAAKTEASLSQTLTDNLSAFMANGLESGAPPAALYEKIKEQTSDMPKERVQKALTEAKKVHVEWATQEAHKLYAQDAESTDAQFLSDRATSMRTGALHDSLFYGIEHTGETFAGMYDKLASDIKKQIENTIEEEVAQNKQMIETVFNMYQEGSISRNAATAMIRRISESTPGDFRDDAYESNILKEMAETIVPARYVPMYEEFIKGLEKINFGITKDKNDPITPEIIAARQYVEMAVWEFFADKAVADMSPSEIQEGLDEIKTTFASKTVNALAKGVVDKWRPINDPIRIDDALEKNHLFMQQSGALVTTKTGPVGGYAWSNPDYEKTFNAIADVLGEELASRGVTLSSPPVPLKIDNKIYPTPLFPSTDGNYYVINGPDIFASKNGSTDWEHVGTIDTVKKFKKEGQLDSLFKEAKEQGKSTKLRLDATKTTRESNEEKSKEKNEIWLNKQQNIRPGGFF